VTQTPNRGKSPNRLLIWLTAVSLGMHLLLFMHLAKVYRGDSMTFIEVSMEDLSVPPTRSIPRPRVRDKTPQVQDAKFMNVRERRVPQIKVEPLETRPETASIGRVSIPEMPNMTGVSGVKVGDWTSMVSAPEFVTRQDYMEMVRLKIESRKKYPEAARSSHKEGRVRVRFTVNPDGRVIAVQVTKSSGHQMLDQAALNTVRDASPFPRVPPNLFKGTFQMEIALAFELM
jgi:protein TonB